MKSIHRLLACAMLALPASYAAPAHAAGLHAADLQATNAAFFAAPAAPGSAVVAAPASQDASSAGNPFPVALPVTLEARGAHSVRTADFDHDGDADVIVASRDDGNIVLHLNQGGQPPAFAASTLATAEGSYMAVPADLNHDGWTDVVVVAVGVIAPSAAASPAAEAAVLGTGKLFWLQNKLAQGQGFAARTIAEGLNYPVAVEAVDLNRDNRLDVVVATRDDGRVLWFENNGNADSFAVRLAAENLPGAAAVHAGDFDSDGRTDLVAAAEDSNQIAWLRNGGGQSPAFELRLVRNGPTPPTGQDFAKSVFAADMDRDGDTDIVFASEQQSQIGWYENGGRGASFSERIVAGDMPHAKSVYAADIDRDGDTDILATAAETGVVAFYENKRGAPLSFAAHTISVGSLGAHSVIAADMDRDGDADILSAAREANSVLLHPNLASHRTALFDPQAQYVVGTYREPRMASAADMDSDGDLDIISVADEVVAWHRNEGGSPPNFTRVIITEGLSGGRWIHAADIDRDNDQDLFVADTLTDRILWYENQLAAPGVTPSFAEREVTNQAVGVRDVHSADLDGDGRLDLYSANDSDNTVTWFEQKSGPSVSFERKVVTNAARYVRSTFAADLNLDGMLDLMSASAEDHLVAWYDNRGGSPLNWIQRVLSTDMTGARHVHAGDLDGDGDMDVVAGAELSDTIAWYENKRGLFSNFNQRVISDDAAGIHSIVTGDADRDGDLDIFAALEESEQLVWYENNGARQPEFSVHLIAANFRIAHSIALGDLDGDGDEDVIATSRGGGQVAWFENLGGQYGISQSAPPSGSGGLQALLHLVFSHKGRGGDPAMRANAVTLRFTTAGRPLSSAEIAGLFTRLAIYHDSNYSGAFEPNQDAELASADSLLLDGAGQLLIPLPADQPGAQIGVGGVARYFVAGETRSGGCLSGGSVQVAHIANALTIVNQQTGYRMAGEAMRGIDSLGAPQDTNQIRVQINEIMADNTRTLEDPNEPQEYPDWIELYNPASVAVNLGGMYLSDDPANAQGYRIPDNVTIDANSYLVFIADEETEQGPLHTNFRLSKGGESVTLIDKAARSYRLLDQVEYEGMGTDVAYGRYPNGEAAWQALGAATPGGYNLNEPLVIQAYLYTPVIINRTACR
jgi:hypothetical protein